MAERSDILFIVYVFPGRQPLYKCAGKGRFRVVSKRERLVARIGLFVCSKSAETVLVCISALSSLFSAFPAAGKTPVKCLT